MTVRFGRKGVEVVEGKNGLCLRIGSRGRLMPAGAAYASLPKGEARRLRKALHAAGCLAVAAIRRAS